MASSDSSFRAISQHRRIENGRCWWLPVITLRTKTPNRPIVAMACLFCHTKLRLTRIRQRETPPAWQIWRHGRYSAKSAEQIISRDKIIAIWESKTEFELYKICFGGVNPNRSLLAASLALRV